MDNHIDFRPVLLAWAALQAEVLGPKKCKRKGVGGVLRHLRAQIDTGLPTVYGASARQAAQLLQSHCLFCGKCSAAGIRSPARPEESLRAD